MKPQPITVDVIITALQVLAKHQSDTAVERALRLDRATQEVYLNGKTEGGGWRRLSLVIDDEVRRLKTFGNLMAAAKNHGMLELNHSQGWLWTLLWRLSVDHDFVIDHPE